MAFYLGLAAIAVLGLFRTMQSQSASRRYLEASHEDGPPELLFIHGGHTAKIGAISAICSMNLGELSCESRRIPL